MKKFLILVMAAACLFSVTAGCSADPGPAETTVSETEAPETTIPETTAPEETEVPTEPVPEIKIEGSDIDTISEQLYVKYKDALSFREHGICNKDTCEYQVDTEIIVGDEVTFDTEIKPLPVDSLDVNSRDDTVNYGYTRTYYLDGDNGEQIPTTGYYLDIVQDGILFSSASESENFQYWYQFLDDSFSYEHTVFADPYGFYGSEGSTIDREVIWFLGDFLQHHILRFKDGEIISDRWFKLEVDDDGLYLPHLLCEHHPDGYTKEIEYVSDDSLIVKHFVEKDPATDRSREYTWDGKGNEPENVVSFEEKNGDMTLSGTGEDIQNGSTRFHMPSAGNDF